MLQILYLKQLYTRLKYRIDTGDSRTVKLKKNVLLMLVLKGASILTGLLMVSVALDYVDGATYGIWLTLSSMVTWIQFFDIGINNGLKNKLAEAWASNNPILAKQYVSTTYAILSLIFIPLMILLILASPYVDWNALLNISESDVGGLGIAVIIIIAYFCLNFILSTINIIYQADQKPALASAQSLIQQLLSLLVIYFLTLTTQGSLLYLCLSLCVAPVVVCAIFNLSLFKGSYRNISPSLTFVDFSKAPSLLKLGSQFFIIQIAFIIQFNLSNFLIIRYYGANEVTSYNVAMKYFNVVYMIWSILIAPVWAAVTDAKARNDYNWIRDIIKKYQRFFLFFLIASFVLLAGSSLVYKIWLGDKVNIPFSLSLWVMLYNMSLMISNLYVTVLNGAGILKLQTICCVISPIIFLLSVFFLFTAGVGVHSILIASIVANFFGLIVAPIQCKRVFK